MMLTKLELDAFGDKILEDANMLGVDTSRVIRTKEANTALAFVSLREDGERDFSFYRNPSADMLLNADEINEEDFQEGDILHFCSASLITAICTGLGRVLAYPELWGTTPIRNELATTNEESHAFMRVECQKWVDDVYSH